MEKNYRKTLLACYLGFITQAITANFAPLLFLKFHTDYTISLGQIALIPTAFFLTQLLVDAFCARFVDSIGYRRCIVISEISSALGLAGCICCGFAVGIMWPGTISITSPRLPRGGTALFALLAMAGDLGGAVGPSLIGTVSQKAGNNLQAGMLAGCVFPLVLIIALILLNRKAACGKAEHGSLPSERAMC